MERGLVVTQLDIQPGECIKVKGKIPSDAKGFAVNVGKDSSNLMLHFNPRFDCHGDVNTIVCNSKEDGMWGEEDRKADFPFQPGDKIEICIFFNETEATVKLPEVEFQFPNRLGMEKIEYLAVEGDFKVKAIKFSEQPCLLTVPTQDSPKAQVGTAAAFEDLMEGEEVLQGVGSLGRLSSTGDWPCDC
ncbi:16 kDa beta-galactoside-binding lectin [Rhynochetos jubatus]